MKSSKFQIGDEFIVKGDPPTPTLTKGVLVEIDYVTGVYRIKWSSSFDNHSWIHNYSINSSFPSHVKLIQNGMDKLDDIL